MSITGAAVLVIVVVAVATSLGGGGGSSPAPAPTKVLITQSGTGNSVTDDFTVAGNYAITYTYDCSKASNSNGNFIVYSYGATNNVVPINEVFSPGGQGTETVVSRPGTYHLTINSECSWSISVKG